MSDQDKDEIELKANVKSFVDKVLLCCHCDVPLLYRYEYCAEHDMIGVWLYEGVTECVSPGPRDGEELQFGYDCCITTLMRLLRRPHVDFDCRSDSEPYIPHVVVSGLFRGRAFSLHLLSSPPFGAKLPVTSIIHDGAELPQPLPPDQWREAAPDPRLDPEDLQDDVP